MVSPIPNILGDPVSPYQIIMLENNIMVYIPPVWNSKADKILKLKHIVKFIANAWAISTSLNAWSKFHINAWSIPNTNALSNANTLSNANASSALFNANTLSNANALSAFFILAV